MVTNLKTSILPSSHTYARIDRPHELNLKAICIFVAIGFFLDDDTYWKDKVCLKPGHSHAFDEKGFLLKSSPDFEWFYEPEPRSFSDVLDQYKSLLHAIITEQITNSPVILPLSGGLDSRSLAMVLGSLDNPVQAFSYEFENGFAETDIAKQVAKACDFQFDAFKIETGYLWKCIGDLAKLNGCCSEFTHPRQMAVLSQMKQMQGVYCLGHWGDVLFDRGVPEGTKEQDLLPLFLKKLPKPSGMELAGMLWNVWGLEGNFKDYFTSRIEDALSRIHIDNASAKARAFKTIHWAHRWTTTNLQVFQSAHPMVLPYYDDRMIEFICKVPETYLADRRLQIAHLQEEPKLAKIVWQRHRPFNLTNFNFNSMPYNLPYRIVSKLHREVKGALGKPHVQRNWELQFLGKQNDRLLNHYLLNPKFLTWIPESLVTDVYKQFKQQSTIQQSHAISMLLTLSLWCQTHRDS